MVPSGVVTTQEEGQEMAWDATPAANVAKMKKVDLRDDV